jgi:hypothetical protein
MESLSVEEWYSDLLYYKENPENMTGLPFLSKILLRLYKNSKKRFLSDIHKTILREYKCYCYNTDICTCYNSNLFVCKCWFKFANNDELWIVAKELAKYNNKEFEYHIENTLIDHYLTN